MKAKIHIIALILVILVLCGIGIQQMYLTNAHNNKYKPYVGKRIVIDNDTLTITMYRHDHYTLSNRAEIDVKLVDKLQVLEN